MGLELMTHQPHAPGLSIGKTPGQQGQGKCNISPFVGNFPKSQ